MINCLNKELCNKKHNSWKRNNQRHLQKYEDMFEEIRCEGGQLITLSNHCLYRLNDRYISIDEIKQVIENGWVVDFNKDGSFIVLGYYKLLNKYQPLHVVLKPEKRMWLIKTLYNPVKELWGDNYDQKICFCGKRRFGEEI